MVSNSITGVAYGPIPRRESSYVGKFVIRVGFLVRYESVLGRKGSISRCFRGCAEDYLKLFLFSALPYSIDCPMKLKIEIIYGVRIILSRNVR